MLTKENAESALLAEMPRVKIEQTVRYKDVWLIRALHDEPGETQLDPFFAVDIVTGEVTDFSIMTADIPAVAAAFANNTS